MTWFLAYHLKWNTALEVAEANNIKVRRLDCIFDAVVTFAQLKSGVLFDYDFDYKNRFLIVFHENEEPVVRGFRFDARQVYKVAKLLQLKGAPRWFTDDEIVGKAYDEGESSEDEQWFKFPDAWDNERRHRLLIVKQPNAARSTRSAATPKKNDTKNGGQTAGDACNSVQDGVAKLQVKG